MASALELKEQGNAAHQRSAFLEACELYRRAAALEQSSAVFPSNLSAAQLELGDYGARSSL